MAKLIGTGKDPLGRYSEGLIFDSDRNSKEFADLIEKGWAKLGDYDGEQPGHFGEKRKIEVANAYQRGDWLVLPSEEKMVDEIEGREYGIIHSDDASAGADEHLKVPEKVREKEMSGPVPANQRKFRQRDAIAPDAPVEQVRREAEAGRAAAPKAPPKQ